MTLHSAKGAALLMSLGSTARLADGGRLLSLGSADNIPLLTETEFSIACPNLSSRDPHPVTVHLADYAILLMTLGSAARLVEDVPNLPSKNPQPMTVQAAGGAALLTVLGSTARLADPGCLLFPGSADDIPLSIETEFSVACPNLSSRDPHPVTVHLADYAILLMTLGSAARLVEDVPNLPSKNPQPMAVRAAESAALLTMGSMARLDGGRLLSPGSADNIPLSIKMGFSIACPNQPPRDPHPVTVHLTECAALLVTLDSVARLMEDVPNLLSRNPHPMAV